MSHNVSTKDALDFYKLNYVGHLWFITAGKRLPIVGNLSDRKCRFCNRRQPEVSFQSDAHAIPDCIGNRTLYTAHECDQCNQYFGGGIENDFGNWSKPLRTLTRIRGKRGVPTIKECRDGGWRIEDTATGLHIMHTSEDQVMKVDEKAKTITFQIPRDPYIPAAVKKCFFKMALSLVNESEVGYFKQALEWISESDHSRRYFVKSPIFSQTVPGPPQNGALIAIILKRKDDFLRLPYLIFIISSGVQTFQVFVPSYQKDFGVIGRPFTFPLFPAYLEEMAIQFGYPQYSSLNLEGTNVVSSEVETAQFTYDDRIPV